MILSKWWLQCGALLLVGLLSACGSDGDTDDAENDLLVEAQTPFITIWQTDNEGITEDNQISITTSSDYEYDYQIDWGDGSVIENATGDVTHTYPTEGQYEVTITGVFPSFAFPATTDTTLTDSLKLISVEQWGDNSWQSMENAFYNADNLVINDVYSPDLTQVSSMQFMFSNIDNLSANLNDWDVSNVNDMTSMFVNATNLDVLISAWDVSNVTKMQSMFNGSDFNADISGWDVSNVTNMNLMFAYIDLFDQDISQWDVSNVTTFYSMFRKAKLFNQDISAWDVSNGTNFYDMFYDAELFNQDISAWDVSNATTLSGMFREAKTFNQDISGWDVSNATYLNAMFREAQAFNQDISGWDVSQVTQMEEVFFQANQFDQNIGSWDVSNVTTMENMFSGSLSTANYDAILLGWSALDSLQSGVTFTVGTATSYTQESTQARYVLTNDFGWDIIDGGYIYTGSLAQNCTTQDFPQDLSV